MISVNVIRGEIIKRNQIFQWRSDAIKMPNNKLAACKLDQWENIKHIAGISKIHNCI